MSNIISLSGYAIPEQLRSIPNPPKELFQKGDNLEEILARPRVAIVGSRKVTPYGKAVTIKFAEELAKQGIVIVSGLALGVDALAHQAALDAGGLTVAILPTGLDKIYPSSHQQLANNIVERGGVLMTEYPSGAKGYPGNFVMRNRLVSGFSDGVLVTEAAEKSGTMHTAAFAREQEKPIFAVPGNITSQHSAGTNNLIRAGATLVTDPHDILQALGIKKQIKKNRPTSDNPHELLILEAIYKGVSDGSELLKQSGLEVQLFNQTLTMLEITGDIKSLGNNQWTLA